MDTNKITKEDLTQHMKVYAAIRKAFDETQTDLPRTTQLMIIVLAEKSGLKMTDLAQSLHISNEQCSRAFEQLVKAGYASRSQNDKNRRIVNAYITPKGMKLFDQFLKILNQ